MKSVEFCYWLQGMFELTNPTTLNRHQTEMIKKHLEMVFIHEIDPSYGNKSQIEKLNLIHNQMAQNNPSKNNHLPVDHSHTHPGDVLLRC